MQDSLGPDICVLYWVLASTFHLLSLIWQKTVMSETMGPIKLLVSLPLESDAGRRELYVQYNVLVNFVPL